MKRPATILTVLLVGLWGSAGARADTFIGSYEATLDPFGGFPSGVVISGTFEFEDLAPTEPCDALLGICRYAVISHTATIGGVPFVGGLPNIFGGGDRRIVVTNDICCVGTQFRDRYSVPATTTGIFNLDPGTDPDLEIFAFGFNFEFDDGPPNLALTNAELPTSEADLDCSTPACTPADGFPLGSRRAFVSFQNLTTGGFFSVSGILDSFSLAPVLTLEESIRALAVTIGDLDLDLFNGSNDRADSGRRKALANCAEEAADLVVATDLSGAIDVLTNLLSKIDGYHPPPDWMDDSPEKTDLAAEVSSLIARAQ